MDFCDAQVCDNTREASVPMKIPLFCVSYSRLYFAQVETIFRMHHVRFRSVAHSCVIQILPTEVTDFIYEIPVRNFYNILLGALIKRNEISDQQPLGTLFTNVDTRKQRTSQPFRSIKQL